METQEKIYRRISDSIIELLEQGVIPWHQTWAEGMHRNLVSGEAYRGINQLSLHAVAVKKEFHSPYWVTFNQCRNAGGHVQKGEKASIVVKWLWLQERDKDTDEPDPDGKTWATTKYFNVFNLDQCEGIDPPKASDTPEMSPLERCENIIAGMPKPPTITHVPGNASYSPSHDVVNVPDRQFFDHAEAYYAVMFHELGHATGHISRIGRREVMEMHLFGTHEYSQEELCAESCVAFLCGVADIEQVTLKNSAAYIQNWLRVLKNDRKCLIYGIQRGQAAADYILGNVYRKE